MLSLIEIAHNVAIKKLYGIEPCKDDFKKAIVASYTALYPECGVVNCFDLGTDVAVGISTLNCPPNTVDLTTQDCNPIYVNRL